MQLMIKMQTEANNKKIQMCFCRKNMNAEAEICEQ